MRDGENSTPSQGVDSHADTAVGDSAELAADDTLAGGGDEAEAVRPAPDPGDRLIGVTLQERYEISAKIGQGGMGAVYEARHTQIGKRVAVKILLDKYAEQDTLVARLKKEAELASSIGHPNIVDIIDFDQIEDGRTFVVMEYLEGESLGSLLAREGRIAPERAVGIGRQVASALAAAHDKSIVHRDIKPENVFLQRRGDADFVKVVDFGISKMVRAEEGVDARLTQTGMVLGTPLYMSPEQARGDESLDHRIDVYALGVILYEMVTGEVPFRGTNYLSIVSQVLSGSAPPPRSLNPEISEDLELVILRAMSRDRAERYQTMTELDADLAALEAAAGVTTAARLRASRLRQRRLGARLARLALFGGIIALVAAVVVFATVKLTGGDGGSAPLLAAAGPPDAAPVAPPPDAAPEQAAEDPDPDPEIVRIRIETIPAGAIVSEGNRIIGVTPFEHPMEKVRDRIELVATLDGYEDYQFPVRPHLDHTGGVRIRLEKRKKPGPRRGGPQRGGGEADPKPGRDQRVDDTAEGDLGGFRHGER